MRSNRSVHRRIRKLEQEIKMIEDHHMGWVERWPDDPDALVYALSEKKGLLVRSSILAQHLDIEMMLDNILRVAFHKVRTGRKNVRNTVRLFNSELFKEAEGLISGPQSMGFKRKIILLRTIKKIDKRTYENLDRLNTLRNRIGHLWTIAGPIRRGVKRRAPKKYPLMYEGSDLTTASALVRFLNKYNSIFLQLVEKVD